MKTIGILTLACAALCAQSAADPDADNCKDSKLVNRMKGCKITECRAAEHEQATLHIKLDENDNFIDKEIEGQYEETLYVCPSGNSPVQISRNMINAFTAAGYQQVMWSKGGANNQYLVMKKGQQWVAVEPYMSGEPYYRQITVLEKLVAQQLAATAEAWTSEIESSGRVRIYGINFDTGKATIRPDSEAALNELQKMLNAKADWRMMIEGHTDNVGAKPANLALSRQRADAVVAWLAAKGIDNARLSTAGFGDSRPVADNATDDGRAKNRRVEVAKL